LIVAPGAFASASNRRRYPIERGIPRLFVTDDLEEDDVTQQVKAFYEKTPFPNYDDLDSRDSLMVKAQSNPFLVALDAQLPDGALVLEAGCGTGQLTNFLGLSWRRRVFGGDICLNSLEVAERFRARFRINNAAFLQMNLFRPPFRDDSIDVVISNGVLHHTGDPRGGFAALLRKVKPGGLIIIGLYNTFARLPTLWRRWAFARFGSGVYFLDRRLTGGRMNEGRWRAWFRDQYEHPHESRHSIDEVLRWFDVSAVQFLYGIPAPEGSPFATTTRLFVPHDRGTKLTRLSARLQMLLQGGRDGGLCIMIGRKRH
jgi:SAM-dependent methyltransferase